MRSVVRAKTLFYIIISNFVMIESGRSIWRPRDPLVPEIITRWVGDKRSYHLCDNHLELYPLFHSFDRAYFMNHLIGDGPIPYRNNPEKTVDGAHLKKLAQELLIELEQKKTAFKHFKTMKSADFNFRLTSGLLILKYKEYPFVLKLFIKTPETFLKQAEGMIPKFFFRMGGGINRHLSGFTRIKNLETINDLVKTSPEWAGKIDLPRKWFWLPENPRWIELSSKNIGPAGEQKTELPAIYGIIADAIESDKTFSLLTTEDRAVALQFAQWSENRVDAHAENFMVEKGTGKIVLIDTEHFPTMIGLKEPMYYSNYPSWYGQLSWKCINDNFLRSKSHRRQLQSHPKRQLFAL